MKTGHIEWCDLTVDNTEEVRDFYAAVVGWKPQDEGVDNYNDYSMLAPDGKVVAGVCHRKGVNADIPPQWLVYVSVESVAISVAKTLELGGKLVSGPRKLGEADFAVVQDPAGAVFALYSEPV